MQKFLRIFMLVALLLPFALRAQTDCTEPIVVTSSAAFTEGFEGSDIPACWTQSGEGSWSVGAGDYSSSTGTHSGSGNALITHSTTGHTTKLITPVLDMSDFTNAQLSFWHVQRSWAGDYDGLTIYYRTSATDEWTVLQDFSNQSYATWTEEAINLSVLSSTYQIAFEMTDAWGYGVGLDDIYIGAAPTCLKVTDLTVSGTTATSITLSWTDLLNEYATYNIYMITPTDTTFVDAVSEDFTYTINDLAPNTVYAFAIETDCGDGDVAADYVIVSGRTSCAPMPLPFSESFDATLANDPCWRGASNLTADSVLNGGVLTFGTNTNWNYQSSASNGIPAGHYQINIYGSSIHHWMITPEIDLSEASSPLLSFNAAFTVYTSGSTSPATEFEDNPTQAFKIFVSTDNGQTWALASDISLASIASSSYLTQFVNLSEYAGETVRIAFYAQSLQTGGDNNLHIDDILVEEVTGEICYPVTNLAASAITSESVTLTWEGDYERYNVYTITATDTTFETVEDNTIDLFSLDANTQYTFGVTSVCSDDNESLMNTITIRTSCAPEALPFSESFDATLANDPCWRGASNLTADSVLNGGVLTFGTNTNWNYQSSASNGIPAGHYQINIYGSSIHHWMITPEIDLSEASSPLLSFNAAFTVYTYGNTSPATGFENNPTQAFKILVSTDNGQTWALASDISLASIASSSYLTQFVNLSEYAGETVRIAFYAQSLQTGGDNNLHIDDILVEEVTGEICYPVTNLAASTITSESVTLTWEGDYERYNVYTITATDTTFETVEDNTIDLSSLDANTQYTFGVTSVCSDDNESLMNTITIHTACLAIEIPFADGFEDGIDCWNLENADINTGISTNYHYEGTHSFLFNWNTNPPQYLISPELSGTEEGLSFSMMYRANSNTYPESFQIGFSTTTNDISAFNWGAEQTDITNTTFEQYSEILPAGTKYVAVKYTAYDQFGLYIDSVAFALPPSCVPVANLTVDAATDNSVTISWIGNAESYDIYKDGEFVESTNANTYTFNGLDANSGYVFGVQAICSETDSSDMVTVSATTECADITSLPYHEGFESGLGCWTTVNGSADGMPWSIANSATFAHSGNNFAVSYSYYEDDYYGYSIHANAWLISPKFVLPTANSENGISLSWWQRVDQNYPLEHYDVMISTTSNDTAAFTTTLLAVTPDSTSDWIQNVVDLTAYAGQEVYVAFHHHDSYDQNYLLIDDIELYQGEYVPDTLTVTFAVNDATMGTTIPAPGTYQYIEGDTIYFAASANAGYHFIGWEWMIGNNIVDTLSADYISVYVPANPFMEYGNMTFTALFEAGNPDSTTITYAVNDPTMGTITPTPGTYTIYVGDNITATATPNDGYVLSAWVLSIYNDGELASSDTTYSDDADFENPMVFGYLPQDLVAYTFTITAIFEAGSAPTLYTVTVNSADLTMGTVTSTASGQVAENTSVTVTATPAEGYHFVAWMSGTTQVSTANPYTFTVTSDITLTATFEANDPVVTYYTVTVNSADLNMGTVTSTASGQVAENTEVTVTATPAEGYHFVAWMNGDAQVSIANPYTFNVTENITLTATFEANEPVVTYYEVTVNSADVNMGTVTSTASGQVAENTEVTVTATPAEGYIFVAWMNGNDTVSTANPYTFTVTGDITLTAVFQYEIGIDDFDFSNVNVYSTKSTIIVNGAENQDIFVYDMNGRCIYKHFNANETERINVLSAGAYLVRISNGVTKKVVVVK